ncbi:putative glycosyltransferase [Patulibacter medicamentivorans]|uniref:Putative glycosyltransferase n=1 Tax=Patulibacter medicamentivorans TaxID=1097667 RepID=H0E5Y7_9ACTN|nr:glycosyltransferase family A protein [Patulibacter medicamentivorans]EHN10907.1 putative glycosyltransferase [Patulibacter medicamentivorans]
MRAGVVLPVRGFSPYLIQTLDAVLAQTRPAAAVVVVDDGSTRPVALHPDHVGRVQLLRLDRSRGPGAARNAGVAALPEDVDFVAFCDHDDVWDPGHLAAHARAIQRHPEASILTGDTTIVGPDDRPTGERWNALHPGAHRSFLVLPLVYERHPLCTSATVVRRAALEAVGGFDEELPQAEDLDLWLRLLEAGSDLVAVLGATVRYRRHPGGLTHDLITLAESLLRVHRAHAEQVQAPVVRRATAADLRGMATGLARVGAHERARAVLAEADALLPPRPVERLRRALLAVPLLRTRIGRGDPYGAG